MNELEALRYSGLMGHRFTVLEHTDEGWRTAGESDTYADAERMADKHEHAAIYEQTRTKRGKRRWVCRRGW